MKQLVSIVIPAYNAEKTLRQCLLSVLNQTHRDYEVIVVDNNSTDKTEKIIKELQRKNKKIKYIFEKRKGRGSARNAGIKKAKGEIIVMTDSDCIVPENWIQGLTKPIVYENESAVMSPVLDLIKNYWTKNIQKADQEFFKRNLNGRYISHIGTGNFAIRSSTMKRLMFDSNIEGLEDFELCLRLKGIAKIRFFPTIKVGHHHPSSFQKYVKNSFQRGYWVKKIFEKHKKNIDIEKEPMFESLSFKNFLFFPFWMILQFIKRPIGEAYFTLVSEVSWRAGILWAILF